jgi:hypothetical protein
VKTPEEVGMRVLERLAAINERRRAQADALTQEVREILERWSDTARPTAKRVRQRLARDPRPSVRTIRRHLKAARR